MPEQLLDYETFRKIQDKFVETKIELGENAREIYRQRYLRKNLDGSNETIEERLSALAIEIASADMNYMADSQPEEAKIGEVESCSRELYDLMINKDVHFNSPAIMNFGRFEKRGGKIIQKDQMGSACFVLPLEDEFGGYGGDGILDQVTNQSLIHKSGGGTGFSFERLRPAGSIIGYNPEVHGVTSRDLN